MGLKLFSFKIDIDMHLPFLNAASLYKELSHYVLFSFSFQLFSFCPAEEIPKHLELIRLVLTRIITFGC